MGSATVSDGVSAGVEGDQAGDLWVAAWAAAAPLALFIRRLRAASELPADEVFEVVSAAGSVLLNVRTILAAAGAKSNGALPARPSTQRALDVVQALLLSAKWVPGDGASGDERRAAERLADALSDVTEARMFLARVEHDGGFSAAAPSSLTLVRDTLAEASALIAHALEVWAALFELVPAEAVDDEAVDGAPPGDAVSIDSEAGLPYH